MTIVAVLCRCFAAFDEQTLGLVYGSTGASSDWVRTADGWERSSALAAPSPSSPGVLHPLLVAALQAGVSVMALLGFSHYGQTVHDHRRPSTDASEAASNAYRLV